MQTDRRHTVWRQENTRMRLETLSSQKPFPYCLSLLPAASLWPHPHQFEFLQASFPTGSESLHFHFGLIWFLSLIQMSSFFLEILKISENVQGVLLFFSSLEGQTRNNKLSCGTQVMGFPSRFASWGGRYINGGGNSCQELEETHRKEPGSLVVLRHTAWVSSQPSPPTLYLMWPLAGDWTPLWLQFIFVNGADDTVLTV